ncbi:hypothetical protein LOD99_14252 [Oopsacas minuta]|uniref:RRM domain-containing protein n=1 Tax=Oopsacas minuta TaxID=111878 RepID=A0AAV7KEY2_9METZ|nr:hypothetical protein LOD99_14252 [Oopsacas minuta]
MSIWNKRYIEVFRSNIGELLQIACRQDLSSSFSNILGFSPNRCNINFYEREEAFCRSSPRDEYCNQDDCVRLRGLPYSATVDDILDFFNRLADDILPRGIHFVYNQKGQPTGECYVQMCSHDSAHLAAESLHKRFLESRSRFQLKPVQLLRMRLECFLVDAFSLVHNRFHILCHGIFTLPVCFGKMNVGDHGVELRSKAIWMLEGDITQKEVATRLNVGAISVRRWWSQHKCGETMETKPRSGRPQILKRVSRIVIKKSLGKRRQSTRKLSRRLSIRGNPISHMTIQRHLAQRLDARHCKRPKWEKITQKIKENRLKFARDHENWSFEDWNNVFWSDESPVELFHSPNRQNDRVWAIGSQNIEPIFQVKFPAKIMVWGMVSYRVLSELHIVPPKQTVNGGYYRNEILKKSIWMLWLVKLKRSPLLRGPCWKHVKISVPAGWCPRTHN